MKIVISSSGSSLQDKVDPRFGRAAYLCIYDTDENKIIEVIDNTEGVNASQGAGINAAGLVASKGVEAILTGRVGPKAMAVVEKANIKVVSGVSGTVAEAVAGFSGDSGQDTMGSSTPPAGRQGQGQGQGQGRGCGGQGRGLGQGQGQGQGCKGQGRGQGRG